MSGYHFILGARDPEMEQVVGVLTSCGISYEWATINGLPVNPKNAYDLKKVYRPAGAFLVAVECDGQAVRFDHRCDHHKLGDPGFDKGPDRFWEGSSLGQVIDFLRQEGMDIDVTHEMRMAAASDHCPAHAYKGLCPGIDPDEFMNFRVTNQAFWKGMSLELLMGKINHTMDVLRGLDKRHYEDGFVVDIRGIKGLEEVAEASLRLGYPVEYLIPEPREGRMKAGILNGSEGVLRAWMEDARGKYDDVYGNPFRGYVGGYLKAEDMTFDHHIQIASAIAERTNNRFLERDISRLVSHLMMVEDKGLRLVGLREAEESFSKNTNIQEKIAASALLDVVFGEMESKHQSHTQKVG